MDRRRERRVTFVIAAATLLAIPLIGVALVSGGKAVFSSAFGSRIDVDCDEFAFDRSAWKDRSSSSDAQEEQGVGLAECGTLDGLSTTQVEAMLGHGYGVRRVPAEAQEWTYGAGFVNEGFGGEFQTLSITFGQDGKVASVRLKYALD